MSIYGEDLAYIHDVGFGEFASQRVPEAKFEARTLSGYGSMKLPENHKGFIARKSR